MFTEQIPIMAWQCRFMLYNIKKIRPYLQYYAVQLLVQALVTTKLDYCKPLLANPPSNPVFTESSMPSGGGGGREQILVTIVNIYNSTIIIEKVPAVKQFI